MKKSYNTKCKDLIMKYIASHKEIRFSAYDIFEYMQANGKQVNLTTIYRNLNKLTIGNLLIKFKTAENECYLYQYVEPNASCHNHLHTHCRVCGKVNHLDYNLMRDIKKHLVDKHGFYLECLGSNLTGLCDECRER